MTLLRRVQPWAWVVLSVVSLLRVPEDAAKLSLPDPVFATIRADAWRALVTQCLAGSLLLAIGIWRSSLGSRRRFTIADLFCLQFVLAGLLGIGLVKQRLMGGNGLVVVLLALSFACLGSLAIRASFSGFTAVVVTVIAGGIGGTFCGRLKQDLLEAGLAGLAVGVIAAIACHWAEASTANTHLR
jgi:hypothetical protein